MAHKTLIGGTGYEITGGRCLVGGTGYNIKKGRTLVGGTGYDVEFAGDGTLGSIAEGSIVYLNESGSPVAFYVAKHDYEPDLNGAGRTLLLRKDCYDQRVWRDAGVASYRISDIDEWLNKTYKNLLDAAVQTAMATTKFYCTNSYSKKTVETLNRAAFLLSWLEIFGTSSNSCNDEGSALAVRRSINAGRDGNGNTVYYWMRTVSITKDGQAGRTHGSGASMSSVTSTTYWSRPAFTLPSTSLFDPDTMQYIS